MYFANTKDPDQTVHLHIVIRNFTVNQYSNQCFLRYTIKDADLSARIIRSLSLWFFSIVDVHLMFLLHEASSPQLYAVK